mmetsp:Transcript_137492/g.343024  ORF Transcript_137492/g.343024 Transcript_137492/m.343024 type:complete len:209 (+) Transcript_137492:171-797(+)
MRCPCPATRPLLPVATPKTPRCAGMLKPAGPSTCVRPPRGFGPRLGVCVGCRCRNAAPPTCLSRRVTERPRYPTGLRAPRTPTLKPLLDPREIRDALPEPSVAFVGARVLLTDVSSESKVYSVKVSGSLNVSVALDSHQVTGVAWLWSAGPAAYKSSPSASNASPPTSRASAAARGNVGRRPAGVTSGRTRSCSAAIAAGATEITPSG